MTVVSISRAYCSLFGNHNANGGPQQKQYNTLDHQPHYIIYSYNIDVSQILSTTDNEFIRLKDDN